MIPCQNGRLEMLYFSGLLFCNPDRGEIVIYFDYAYLSCRLPKAVYIPRISGCRALPMFFFF